MPRPALITVFLFLALLSVALPSALAQEEPARPEELWEEFPLDSERSEPPPREGSQETGSGPEESQPAPETPPPAEPERTADESGGGDLPIALMLLALAAVIVVLVATRFLVSHAKRRPQRRRAEAIAPARASPRPRAKPTHAEAKAADQPRATAKAEPKPAAPRVSVPAAEAESATRPEPTREEQAHEEKPLHVAPDPAPAKPKPAPKPAAPPAPAPAAKLEPSEEKPREPERKEKRPLPVAAVASPARKPAPAMVEAEEPASLQTERAAPVEVEPPAPVKAEERKPAEPKEAPPAFPLPAHAEGAEDLPDDVIPFPTAAAPRITRPPAPARGPRALGYVSAADAEGGGGDLEAQTEQIRTACLRNGFESVEVVRDFESLSGSDLERPGLTYALEKLEAGEASCLVVASLERLTRSAAHLGTLIDRLSEGGIRLVVLDIQLDTGNADGRLAAEALANVGSLERRSLDMRTRKGLKAARETRRSSGRPAVADRPALKERIADMRASGMTLQAIADTLNNEGVPTLRGGTEWRPSSVQAAVGYKRPKRGARKSGDESSNGSPGDTQSDSTG